MSTHAEILDIVMRSITAYLGAATNPIRSDSMLKESYDLDSTEMVFVAVEIEKALGVSLKGIPFGTLKTPNDIAVVIEARLLAAAQNTQVGSPSDTLSATT